MSTYQVISMTGSMYWDQWEIHTQVEFYERVYAHIQRTQALPSDKEIIALMPPVLQTFRSKYIHFKKTINEWDKTPDPEKFLLDQSLTIKNLEIKNAQLEYQMSSLTDQVQNQFGISNLADQFKGMTSPGRGKGSSSSASMPSIPEEFKEQRVNIFQPGAQIKRSASGVQRMEE